MKKSILIILSILTSFMVYSKPLKQNETRDNFIITVNKDSDRYTVSVSVYDEEFVWFFDSFEDCEEHYNWLKDVEVWSFSEDKRYKWREYAYYEDVSDDGIWTFYIDKDLIIDGEKLSEWR